MGSLWRHSHQITNRADGGNGGQDGDEVDSNQSVALALVEHNLQASQARATKPRPT